jgi:hypothetical protein
MTLCTLEDYLPALNVQEVKNGITEDDLNNDNCKEIRKDYENI